MKTARKVLMLILCAALLVSATVMGTLAYLTDDDAVVNTFTVGNIVIELDEADVKLDGTIDTTARVKENAYKLMPGHEYIKDPTIRVDGNSEACYLFVKVVNGIEDIEAAHGTEMEEGTYATIAEQMDAKGWDALDAEKYPNVYFLADKDGEAVTANAGENRVVFENFMIDGNKVVNVAEGETAPEGKFDIADFTTEDNDVMIVVDAYAVQLDGFNTPADAWDATFGA